ncbi:MAG: iron-sulfur cluster assembly accessory protein [Bacteroidota bacterium]
MTETAPLLAITDAARVRLGEVAQTEGINTEQTYLRVAVVPGGCSGLTYDLGWDTTVQETDEVADLGDLRVVLDPRSLAYVEGTTLDFSDGLEGQGFHFHNPQAIRTFACGESFSL